MEMDGKKLLSELRKRTDWKVLLTDLVYDLAGSILYAAGIYTFAGNAGFAPGGISGLALLLNHLSGFPVGTLTLFFQYSAGYYQLQDGRPAAAA